MEIVPLLWMGGRHYQPLTGIRAPIIVRAEFDLVISLYTREGHGPDSTVEHRSIDIPDGPLIPEQIEAVGATAALAADAVNDGRRVLVRCHCGYNRSDLVAAQALINQGYGTDDAIFLIRYHRSNRPEQPALRRLPDLGLDVARLLTGLDA